MVLFLSPGYTAEITLSWDRNTEKDIAGYKVLSGTNSRNYTRSIDVGNTNSCAISGLQEGITYYFAAIAYNTSGLESGFSNEVSYRVPQSMAASGSLLYADYGSSGTWMWNGDAWVKLSLDDPQNMAASGSLLYADYGSSGIWMWNGSIWTKISEADPQDMAASDSLLYADYGPSGTWMWNGSAWTTLSPDDPQSMAVAGSFLYADYGPSGTWMWDGSTWSRIAEVDLESMVTP